MKNIIDALKLSLEELDRLRDKALFVFIRPCWPRFITPNHLTYLRIIIGITLAVLLFFFSIEDRILILSLFTFGVLTDLFDGSVSRCLNKVTAFGEMLDPIADRILLLPIGIYSLYKDDKWLLLCLIAIEFIGGLLSLYYKSKNANIKVNIFGKTKMVLVSLVFIGILIYWPTVPFASFLDILWASLILSFLSIFVQILELQNKGLIKNKIINKQLEKYEARSKNI